MDFFCAGRAFLLAGGLVGAPHLWFVLTDPDPVSHQVVIVMLVSAKAHTDKTVVLRAGDHPWVRHESNVDFGSARPIPVSKLMDANSSNRLVLQDDMSKELLAVVRAGLLASSRTIHAVKDDCKTKF